MAGAVDSDGMDLVQSSRILARSGKFSTNIVRPYLTSRLSVNGDGTSPDFAHAPLYSLLVAGAQRAAHQTSAGQGDREAVLVSVVMYMACIGATALLARKLFGSRIFGMRVVVIATLFFALASNAAEQSLMIRPTMLGALLFTLLVYTLFVLDTRSPDGQSAVPPVSLPYTAVAGLLFGLLYLSLYSALLLFPIIVFHLYRINSGGRRAMTAIAMFLLLFAMVAGPLLARNERLVHNPLYNARLLDLVQNTPTNPGYSLLGRAVPPRTLSNYLINGGAIEIAQKAGRNITGFYADAPVVIGLFVLPLFVLSALIRFHDVRVNQLRNIIYVCIAVHVLGLAPFQPYRENVPTLLIYAPIIAVLSAGFLLSIIKARNLPSFYSKAVVTLWVVFACLPGAGQILSPQSSLASDPPYKVYNYLDQNSNEMVTLRTSRAYIMADVPWEAAYRMDVPVLWLPTDAADMKAITERTGRPIGAILLSPAVSRWSIRDPAVGLWATMYNQISAVTRVAAGLDPALGKTVLEKARLYYPAQLSDGMTGFTPERFPEQDRAQYSLLFWNDDAMTRPKPVEPPLEAPFLLSP